jgi:hypothetical protein
MKNPVILYSISINICPLLSIKIALYQITGARVGECTREKRTQPRANCSVACYVSWRTRFADCKRVKNEISGIPEEPQTSLSSFGVRRGYAWNAFPSERLRYGPIPMWHPWSGHQDLWPMEISGFSTLYRSGDDSIAPCEYLVWDTHV